MVFNKVNIEISPAAPDQAALVHRIMQTAFAEYVGRLNPPSACHSETLADTLASMRAGGAVLAWAGDVAIGSARYELRRDSFYVGRVSVLPGYRGCGAAAAMLAYLEGVAHWHGYAQMELTSRLALPRNVALYERLGYHIVESWQINPQADVQVRMVKPIGELMLEMA